MTTLLSLDHIGRAASLIAGHVHRTPMFTSRTLNQMVGHTVYLKCENLQRAGAFKIRGALHKLMVLSASERARGVVAFSSGNHAQGLALAASIMQTNAMILMPCDAPELKLAAVRDYGAQIVFYDRQTEDRESRARELAATTGRVLVPPYDDYEIMAGQGTVALEMLEDIPHLDALLAPIGGGGLMAGCAIAAKAMRPDILLYGVEPEQGNDTWLSLRRGERVAIAPPDTIADGARITVPGSLTFPILARHLCGISLVSDLEIVDTMRWLLLRQKIVVEPTGALTLAALMCGRIPFAKGATVGVVLSGGNLDLSLLQTL
jgi:threonine dehydratase